MSINLSVPEQQNEQELKPRIMVVGVGGAGGNAVNDMIAANLDGVEFLAVNTDAQALQGSNAARKVQMGAAITSGLGAGARPEVGSAAAEESLSEIMEHLDGSNMAFIAAGMGGGTGTGGAPVIAKAARELGILTVGVVTKPFHFEGVHRMRLAEKGIEELEGFVDTLIVIPNQNLFRIANEKTTFADAFRLADEVLYSGVRGVTDLMIMPGMINLDFADIRSVMSEMGKAMMGTGEAEGERRALDAAEAAIANPLLDDTSMKGARGVLINITGGNDMTLFEVDEAANRIRSEVDEEAYIIFGSAFDGDLDGKVRVSVVATGIDANTSKRAVPEVLSAMERPLPVMRSEPESIPEAKVDDEPLIPFRFTESDSSEPEEAAEEVVLESVPETVGETEFELAEDVKVSEEEVVETEAETEAEAEVEVETDAEVEAEIEVEVSALQSDRESDAVDETEVDVSETKTAPGLDMPATASTPEDEDSTPPVGMPSADTKDAFIPPAPMTATGGEQETPSKPFAVSDLMNGSSKKPVVASGGTGKSRAGSLFGRIMGAGKTDSAKPADTNVQPLDWQSKPEAPVKPASPAATVTPAAETTIPASTSETPVVQAPTPIMDTPAATPQTRLGGMEQAERIPAADHEEDLLDIPAFLRRQAN
jgi:cell division protein FtsZ